MACNASTVPLVRSLRDKLTADPAPSLEKILRILQKLSNLPITIDVLHETGIGKVVNGFRKYNGEISEMARSLVRTWKAMVREAMDEEAGKQVPSEMPRQSEVTSSQSQENEASSGSAEAVSKARSPEKQPISAQLLDSPRKQNTVSSSNSEKLEGAPKIQSPSKSQKMHNPARMSSDVAHKPQSSKSHSTAGLKRSRDEAIADGNFTQLKEKLPASTTSSPVKKFKSHHDKVDQTTREKTKIKDIVSQKSSTSEKKVTPKPLEKFQDKSHDRSHDGSHDKAFMSRVNKITKSKADSPQVGVKRESQDKHHSSPGKKNIDAGHKIAQNKNKIPDSKANVKTATKPEKQKPVKGDPGSKPLQAKTVSKGENASLASDKTKTSQQDPSNSRNSSEIGPNDAEDENEGQSFHSTGMSFAECLVTPMITKVKKVVKNKTSGHLTSPSKSEAPRPGTSKSSASKKTSETNVSKIKGKTSDLSEAQVKSERSKDVKAGLSSDEQRKHAGKNRESLSKGQSSESGEGSDTGRRHRKKRSMSEEEEEAIKQAKKVRKESSDVSLNLPEIQPNYKPMRLPDVTSPQKKRALTAEEEMAYLGSKQGKTKVFSGRSRINRLTSVRRLYDICMEVLCDNIDALDEVGGVPYEILLPVLERCTPQQLFHLEDCNPHFLEDSDPLWQKHVERDFKGKRPAEMESWRELYIREHDARDAKLKSITANISAQMAARDPGRLTKMAYLDRPAKPPRSVMRQQLRHGTASGKYTPEKRSKSTVQPNRPTTIIHHGGSDESSSNRRQAKPTTKVIAPMMMKTIRMIKKLRR